MTQAARHSTHSLPQTVSSAALDAWWKQTEIDYARLLPHFAEFVHEGDLVFDVGALYGEYTMMFRQLGASHVVAVEPMASASPVDVERLLYRYGQDAKVSIVADALSDHEGTATLHISRTAGPYLIPSIDEDWIKKSAHAGYYPKGSTEKLEVSLTTLDALVAIFGIPAFIKIDVEGAGRHVIRGLHTPVKALNFETHYDWLWDAREAAEHLLTLGDYEFNFASGTGGCFQFDPWLPLPEFFMQMSITLDPKRGWGDCYARLRT